MKIERYYYTEAKRRWNQTIEGWQGCAQGPQEEETPRTAENGQSAESEADASAAKLVLTGLSEPAADDHVIDQKKWNEFRELARLGMLLAQEIRANLQICTEDLTGSIIFAGEEMNYTGSAKALLGRLSAAADEVHIRVSSDTGEGSAIDIDGLVQTEYWFDFYTGPWNVE